jgi:hypothetical protein
MEKAILLLLLICSALTDKTSAQSPSGLNATAWSQGDVASNNGVKSSYSDLLLLPGSQSRASSIHPPKQPRIPTDKKENSGKEKAVKPTNIPEPLSFEITGFSSFASNSNAILQWKMADSLQVQQLAVEQSADGTFFEAVSTILMDNGDKLNGIITSQENGTFYYRLKILTQNGLNYYSKTLTCQTNYQIDGNVTVYADSKEEQAFAYVNITTAYRGKTNILINDELGKKLLELQIDINSAKPKVPLGVANLAPGTYYIYVMQKNGTHIGMAQQFVKN